MTGRGPALTALSIVPDRELASQFTASNERSRSFQIVAELKAYPTNQALEVRLRQVKPDVILLDLATDLEAVARINRLLRPEPLGNEQPGSIIAFSSAKPGSGASTLAAQTSFALRRTTSKRVLLADFDLMGGMIGFYLKLTNTKSLLDALHSAERLGDGVWHSL